MGRMVGCGEKVGLGWGGGIPHVSKNAPPPCRHRPPFTRPFNCWMYCGHPMIPRDCAYARGYTQRIGMRDTRPNIRSGRKAPRFFVFFLSRLWIGSIWSLLFWPCCCPSRLARRGKNCLTGSLFSPPGGSVMIGDRLWTGFHSTPFSSKVEFARVDYNPCPRHERDRDRDDLRERRYYPLCSVAV